MNNIIFVTALHGNETKPTLALASVGVEQIIGNPEAVSKNVRFIEKDLNASFGTRGRTYEEKEAKNLLKHLDKDKYIVDFHTNQSMSQPFAIVVDKKMIEFAKRLGLPKIVYMKFNIKKKHSLIDLREGVSVEVGKHNSIQSIRTTIKVVDNLKRRSTIAMRKITLYEVFDIIRKPGEYVNFRMCNEGFVPLFSGRNSYNTYGLKARIMENL